MLRDSVRPPVQSGLDGGDNVLLPPFSDITEENPRSFRRILCIVLLMRANTTKFATYNSSESKCEDMG